MRRSEELEALTLKPEGRLRAHSLHVGPAGAEASAESVTEQPGLQIPPHSLQLEELLEGII